MREGWEIILCPVCRQEIKRIYAAPIKAHSSMSSRSTSSDAASMLTAMMLSVEQEHQEMLRNAQEAIRNHFESGHTLRLWLWKKVSWQWLFRGRWPWSKPGEEERLKWQSTSTI